MTDTATTRPYGVLGRVLGHSYTPTIYKELAGLEYVRFEREPEDLEAFMTGDEWEGTNVTIPYKRAVMDYLDELSPLAERMGNVNTITRLPDGLLRGDNTDYFGFQCLVEELGVEVADKKALVLGATGGAGTTASMVLDDLDAIVVPVGRTSEVNYDNIAQQSDAMLLVNCTPAGMFPHCPDAPCALEGLDALEGVIDIVYNPARTGLMLEAERRGIPCIGGLLMLVAQAAQAVERYTGKATPHERILDVTERLSRREQNIALIGMPGSGKTRVLTSRIAYMIEQGVAPFNILALTFTNKAAQQMRERIAQMIPDNRSRYIRMGTFHSVFSRILRENAEKIGFPESFTIYEPSDCKNLIKTIVRELNLADEKYKPNLIASRISYAKNCLVTPGAYLANSVYAAEDRQAQIPEFGNVYNIYCQRCKRNGAMDFDDLLLQTNIHASTPSV